MAQTKSDTVAIVNSSAMHYSAKRDIYRDMNELGTQFQVPVCQFLDSIYNYG